MTATDAPDWERVEAERTPAGLGGLWYGVYPALVTDVRDPDGHVVEIATRGSGFDAGGPPA